MTTKIYIQLLDEGTTTYRPTQGQAMGENVFRVLPTPNYDAEDEHWEFPPDRLVVCEFEMKGRERILIARRIAPPR